MNTLAKTFRFFLVLTFLVGVVYPLAVTTIAQVFFHSQAEGSQLVVNGKLLGSALLSQKTGSPKYFWPRPSAGDYATVASGASNLGPTSEALKEAITDRVAKLRTACHVSAETPLPDDMVTTSGSGVDPHITPAAARLQIDRIAAARNLTSAQKEQLAALVTQFTEGPQLGFLGEPRVNVLLINVALDELR